MTDLRESMPDNQNQGERRQTPPLPLRYWVRSAAIAGMILVALMLILSRGHLGAFAVLFEGRAWSVHAPDWTRLVEAGPIIWVHVGTIAAAFVLGIVLLAGPKGRLPHRVLGWIWASLLVVTGIDTLFIHTPGVGPQLFGFSPLHAFSIWALIGAPLGVYYARRHNVARHRMTMTSVFLGALVIAGVFAFLPGRIMHSVVFG
jgi:uncharacterized membrane protein